MSNTASERGAALLLVVLMVVSVFATGTAGALAAASQEPSTSEQPSPDIPDVPSAGPSQLDASAADESTVKTAAQPNADGDLRRQEPASISQSTESDGADVWSSLTADVPQATNITGQAVPTSFQEETVLSGLSQPTAMTFLPDGRALVLQKSGDVLIVDPDTGASDTYMSISDLDTAGEEGLIDITLDPNFAQNDYIYIYYTPTSSGKNRIARFTHQENSGGLSSSADPSSEFVVWEDNSQRKSDFHHGGGLDFGPDGKLYLTIGEEVDGPQAQDLTEAGGSVIRVNKDGTIPQDNPFVDGSGGNVDAIWAYGLRNPFRAEWDLQSDTPRYYIAEVGGNNQNTAQEDLHIGEKGANYGWPDCEGVCDNPDYTDALYTYPHEGSGASITGGVVYHGDQFPSQYDGAYFFADYVRGWMKYLQFDSSGNVSSVNMFDDSAGTIVEIDQGPDGSLFYLDIAAGTLEKVSYDQTADAEPTLDAPESVFVDEGESTQITITASDADGDTLSLSASNLPSFASFTDNGDGTATLSLSPSSGDAGSYQPTVTVSDGDDTTSEAISVSVLEPGADQVLYRLNAGPSSVQAIDGGLDWESDSQYMQTAGDASDWSGTTYSVGQAVPSTTPDAIFESERYPTGGSTIDYDLSVTSGESYEVRLYFIEQYDQAQNPGDRIFDVSLEGQTVLNDYDVVADVGYKNATMESFDVTADDGTLDLSLTQDGGSHNPLIYGIEVIKPADETNQPPSAAFTASATDVETGQSVDFDASGSSDSDGSIQSYEWDFDGDGQTDTTGAQVAHAFATAGTYTVELTVTDDDGATDTVTETVTVSAPSTQQTLYRVNAGGPELQASDGGPNWASDNASSPSQYIVADGNIGNTVWPEFEPGTTYSVGQAVPASTPTEIFDYERYTTDSELEYSFPVTQGETYEIRLYYIELFDDANGSADRVMDISAEGQTLLSDYDTSNEVGFENGTMESFEVTADDGTLDLSISDVSNDNNANVFGIEVIEPGDQPNQPPTPTISSPADGTVFQAGDTISYSGSATDPEDGTLPDTQLEWTVQFLHNEHFHPYQSGVVGSSGSFDIPTSGHDFHDDTRYKIILEATDSEGATNSTHVIVEPDKVNLTFQTDPSGLEFNLDGIPYTSPYVHDTLVDFQHTITAPQTQCVDGTQYEFDSWSDGGAAEHTITVPSSDTTYTATYSDDGQCGTGNQTIAEAVASQNAPTDQIGQQEIQVAINWWATESEVPGTDGELISQLELQQLINMWATSATVGDGNQPPTADFHVHDPIAGQSATYHAQASDSDGSIQSYEWDFDDDGTFEESTTNAQIQHTFQSAGDYSVSLRVTDDDGATDTITKTVSVAQQQTAQVLYRVNAGGPELQATDDGPSWESDNSTSLSQYIVDDGNLDNTVWPTFEPGQTYSVGSAVPDSTPDAIFDYERWATDEDLEYSFPVTSGETYEVRVYLIERFTGANGSADRVIDVSAEGQAFLTDYDTSNEVGWKNGTMESFEVTADDGTIDLSISQDAGSQNSPNVFGIEVLENTDGATNQQPDAAFTVSPPDPNVDETVTFDASGSTDSDGSVQSYAWDFDGDGQTDAMGQTATNAFATAGDKTVELTVTDDDGATDTATQTVSVSGQQVIYRVNAGGPELQATDGGPNWAVDNATDQSQSPYLVGDGDVTVHDQQFTVTETVPSSTPDQIFVTERYVDSEMDWEFPVTQGETYEVRLYYIEQWAPNAQVGERIFDVSIDGTTVQNDYDVMADVGFDNATMKSFEVTAADGTLDLDFTQDGGSAYPLIYGIEILGVSDGNQLPIASFTASPTNANTGETVSFDASGSSDPDGSIASYSWDFGDGETATGATPSHTYDTAGTYTVELTVTDDDGATTTVTEQVSVSEPASGEFVTEQMASGLQQPVAMEVLPDDRMLILERDGGVLIAQEQGSSLSTSEYLSLSSVSTNGEQGLLGVTIDPDFQSNGYVYLYYTNENTDRNQISRFVHQENGGGLASTADPASETKIWNSSIQGDATFHHGGGLDFGPDGKLYLTTGEQFTSTRAQDLSSTGGKIIRINKDGSIPSDNPYVNDGDPNTRGDIWASGLRNPFRAEWDHETNRFFVAEVGLETAEDIHLGEKGANYGWPNCEGECSDPAYTDPIYSYPYDGGAAVTGGDFYRGSQFPSEYEGVYFYGDYVRGWIKYLTFDSSGNVTGSQDFVDDASNVVEIDQGPDGSLYYIDITGSVHRISYVPAEEGSATVSLNEGNSNIDTSTWKTGAVEIDNTGDKAIESVSFDLSTTAMPDIVFGPLTDSGTPGNAVKDASGVGGFQTSYSQPHDGNPDDGYDELTFTFDDFQPGETFTVSLDTDATSIKGATPIQQGLEISGLETTGTTVTVEYTDGTTQTTTPFSDGSAAGAKATSKSDVPPAPTLDVQGVTLDQGALEPEHSAATVSTSQQTVEVSGPPGATVRVLRFEGELNLDGVSGYDLEPYEANRLLNADEQTVTLDNNGEATVDVTLTNSSATGGLNYIVATVEDDQGDTGITSNTVVLDYDSSAQPSGVEATVKLTTSQDSFPDGKVTLQDATTYFAGSTFVTNTGDEEIETLIINKSTALISSMVFDPTGCAGDGGCNPGDTSIRIPDEGGTGYTDHQFLDPVNGVDGTDGYATLQFNFSDFEPGETFVWASDGDPNSIKGGGGQQSVLAGPESGIDLTGTTVTASFADSTTASSGTFNEGSLAGSTGVARANTPAAPTIDAQGVSLQSTTLTDRHTAATVSDAQQTIEITGPPGETVRLMHAESTLLLEDVPDSDGDGMPGYDIEAYEANNVENYTITNVQLDQNGEATVDVTLTNLTGELTSPADKSGFNYFVAAVEGDDGYAGPASNVAILKLDESADMPSIQQVDDQFLTEGDSTTVTVQANDPNGDPLTLSASNLPGFASFTDDGGGSGTLTLTPQSGDAGTYDITLSASDGDDTTTQQISVTVSEPGADQVVYRLNGGDSTVQAVDGGPDWESDSQYEQGSVSQSDWSGATYSVGQAVPATTPDAIFESERYPTDDNTLDYDLPVTSGESYEVRLYFIEQYSQAQNPGDRILDVSLEGQTVLNDYDVVADVGYKNGTMESFEVTADDGTLDLSLSQDGGSNNALIYGIEVIKPADETNQSPSAALTASATDVETGQSVDFDASGSSDADGSVASYSWDFGDGEIATGATPSHTYDTAGTYTVELTVTDDDGATDTATTTVTVTEPTTASVLYRVNAGGPELPTQNGPNWESDNSTSQSQYLVDDGAVGTTNWLTFESGELNYSVGSAVPESTPDAVFEHERYAGDGDLDWAFPVTTGESYEVRLYLIEQYDPASGSADRVVDVTAEGETLLSGYDTSNEVGFKNGTMESFEVTADDGTLDLSVIQASGSNSPNVFGIEVLALDADGGNQAPSAAFTASATDVETGQSVDFDASGSSDSDGSIQSYEWDFDGDGQTDTTGAQVAHAFSSAGTYTVELTVTDDGGATANATQTVTVSAPPQTLYRVNTGGPTISAADGPDWAADNNTMSSQYLEVNADLTEHDQQFTVTGSVPAETPDQIFVTERWPASGSTLEYGFPATQGESYEVRLYFIEQWDPNAQEGTRIFDVIAEGQTVLNDYDIMADVGFDNATMQSFEVTADDGTIDLTLTQDGGSANPFIYGIEIIEAEG
ncbi:malectin domain-containing carbohydrate-binding protein [Halovenus marina]|uniref:malectin domain-containing carbohydrate-binding protein n=1 Tax=Halovenus marina TaxID=3396621 RepID=UPI003F54D4C7